MKPERMTPDAVQGALKHAIQVAVNFQESEVSQDRIDAQKYFNGASKVEAEEDRSQVVSTKVRDTVRMIEPVLMRTFLQSGKPVEFVPNGPDDIDAAEQATEYATYIFNKNNGFQLLSSAFRDALVKKTGVLKAYRDESQRTEFDEYTDLTDDVARYVLSEEGVEMVEGQRNMRGLIDLKVSRTTTQGQIKIMAVAPEDFFVDAAATSIDNAFVCGDRVEMRVGDVVAMGYDFEEVVEHAGSHGDALDEEEEIARRGYDEEHDTEAVNDPSMLKVSLTEAYFKVDIEGTGIPQLYQFICVGTNYHILEMTLADENPYAIFEVDPEPHSFYGRSIVDMVKDDQDASTSLLRGLIDNMHMSNNTGYAFDDARVDTDDMLNNEMGRLVRVQGTPTDAVMPLAVPNAATAILPAIQYYDQVIEDKTGVSRASMGMDANALQPVSATQANAAIQAASAATELIARHLSEGMRRLFKIILKLTRQHSNPDDVMRVNGQFVPVDPRSWNAEMDVSTNVGLGTGQREQRIAALQQVAQDHFMILQQYGFNQPLVSMQQIYNVRADLLAATNIHNPTRYYNTITPEIEQQFMAQMQQQAQAQQQGSDPNAAYLQAEQMKTSARVQADQMETQRKAIADQMADDRARDEMEQRAILKAAELFAKHQAQVQPQITAPIRQMQALPRQ